MAYNNLYVDYDKVLLFKIKTTKQPNGMIRMSLCILSLKYYRSEISLQISLPLSGCIYHYVLLAFQCFCILDNSPGRLCPLLWPLMAFFSSQISSPSLVSYDWYNDQVNFTIYCSYSTIFSKNANSHYLKSYFRLPCLSTAFWRMTS